jgi:hypothetical protein
MMTNNEYNLIKLVIEMTELDPFSFDHASFSFEDLKPASIREGIKLYMEATSKEDMTDDEIDVINRINKELEEYYSDFTATISYELKIDIDTDLNQEEYDIILGVIEERIEVEKNHKDTFKFEFENPVQ